MSHLEQTENNEINQSNQSDKNLWSETLPDVRQMEKKPEERKEEEKSKNAEDQSVGKKDPGNSPVETEKQLEDPNSMNQPRLPEAEAAF